MTCMLKELSIQFQNEIWKEGDMFIAYAPQLDISSCGKTVIEAKKNILAAVEGFIEEARNLGTLNTLLEESGFVFEEEWQAPKIVSNG